MIFVTYIRLNFRQQDNQITTCTYFFVAPPGTYTGVYDVFQQMVSTLSYKEGSSMKLKLMCSKTLSIIEVYIANNFQDQLGHGYTVRKTHHR